MVPKPRAESQHVLEWAFDRPLFRGLNWVQMAPEGAESDFVLQG